MELTESFTLPVSAERLWDVLIDIEAVAPCVPGFVLREAADPEYRGEMTIKVGAATVTYDATLAFVERDEAARKAVLSISGKERRGGGRVDASVDASLTEGDQGTTVEMVTDVKVTGRVAQFGGGIIADVSARLTREFVQELNQSFLAPSPAPDAAAPPGSASTATAGAGSPDAGAPPAATQADEALDLGAAALAPVLKRAIPAVACLMAIVLIVRWISR